MEVFNQLRALAPDAEYWTAVEWLQVETNKPDWGGFSSVNLKSLPAGVIIPDEFNSILRHDETLEVLIAYGPISEQARDRVIASTPSAEWHQAIARLVRESRRSSACFLWGWRIHLPPLVPERISRKYPHRRGRTGSCRPLRGHAGNGADS